MYPPLYNDAFIERLNATDAFTHTEAMAKLIQANLCITDEGTGVTRPALLKLHEAAQELGVMPVEVFTRLIDEVLHGFDDEHRSITPALFLAELVQWLVLERPVRRFEVLEAFSAHQEALAEDRQQMHAELGGPGHSEPSATDEDDEEAWIRLLERAITSLAEVGADTTSLERMRA